MTSLRRHLAILLLPIILLGAGCGGSSTAQKLATTPVTITIWRVFDDSSTLDGIMSAYKALHPNISFSYRELRYDEYEDELIRAFAEGEGPDIFSLHNTWIGKYESLIEPMPDSLTIPYSETRGTIKKETVYTVQEEPTMSERALKSDFVDVVVQDVLRSYKPNSKADAEDRIFGLPLGMDSLALFYNKDLLNAAGIPEPPTTWTEFQDQVTQLTQINTSDSIVQAGAAIGTSQNVERAFDILSILMMQNGTQMTDSRGRATFAQENDSGFLGGEAVRFYTDFANPLKAVYTWNKDMPDSFDAFISGNTAFFFGYSYHYDLIRAANSKLDFSVSPLPQIDGGKTLNYANYWVETVAKSTDASDWAWDFVQFAASEEQVGNYLESANKPAALRGLINSQLEDEVISIFAGQTLTAESWYRGSDASVAEEAFLDLIDAFLEGSEQERALKDAQNKTNQSL
ncbi:MAG: Extracellular solute-binding protein family 1 [Candidatus Uhrbacteria bacterium GW2011_GWA2_52_8d]|uniref:Extracellular solute-binding protein family 1 n=1 Tax=Candidatus Uhrbacteria bacterium GW2011_GWA2_52_8d TaxID=1618979 RepID=A0A0G1ZWB6_9BACT|nr:MAG: Extracellular solute-binding protein family 1 [Candidatus Uhrbacteria bacterium GW2011_GWA2_52_8d]